MGCRRFLQSTVQYHLLIVYNCSIATSRIKQFKVSKDSVLNVIPEDDPCMLDLTGPYSIRAHCRARFRFSTLSPPRSSQPNSSALSRLAPPSAGREEWIYGNTIVSTTDRRIQSSCDVRIRGVSLETARETLQTLKPTLTARIRRTSQFVTWLSNDLRYAII